MTAAVYDYDAIAKRARELRLSGIVEASASTEASTPSFMYGVFGGTAGPAFSTQVSTAFATVITGTLVTSDDFDCP